MWYHFAPPMQTRSITIPIDMFYVFWSNGAGLYSNFTSYRGHVAPFPVFWFKQTSWLAMILPMRKGSRDREHRGIGVLHAMGIWLDLEVQVVAQSLTKVKQKVIALQMTGAAGFQPSTVPREGNCIISVSQFVTNKISIWKNIWSIKRNSKIDSLHGFYYPFCGC